MDTGNVGRWSEPRNRLKQLAVAIAPYVILELCAPGGTFLAFLLFLHRRKLGTTPPKREDSPNSSPSRDYGMGGAFAAMAACSVILVVMCAA